VPVSLQLLAGFPFFRSLPGEELQRLSAMMRLRSFARREMVVEKDQARSDLGFLIEGRLQGLDFTVDARSVGLYFIEPGDYFGELSVVDGQPASEFIVAATKSTAAFIDGAPARRLILGTPSLAQSVMNRLARRVRAATAQRTLLSLPNPFQRLCAQILQLAGGSHGGAIDPAPTHQELAIMINASRETVTRAFQVLFAHQALKRDGAVLRVTRLDFFRNIAEGRLDPPKT
jgi:CRP-like cAMP-binding protein